MIAKILALVLLYAMYRILRAKYFPPAPRARKMNQGPVGSGGQLDDILIKCPKCDLHFPKAQGCALVDAGRSYYFCSTRCRDRFRADSKRG